MNTGTEMINERIGMPEPKSGGASSPNWYEVNIQKAHNGFIVHVGCRTFVFRTWDEVSEGLALYWVNPQEAARKYAR